MTKVHAKVGGGSPFQLFACVEKKSCYLMQYSFSGSFI